MTTDLNSPDDFTSTLMASVEGSDILTSDQEIFNPDYPSSTHNLIGVYLVTIGILGTFGNGLILAMFFQFRSLLTPTAVLLVNLSVADLGICIFGFPFSASSSFNNGWLFGEGGCQWYAFTGFLMGSAHISTLCLLAIDRYLVTCRSNLRGKLTYRRYCQFSIFIWLYAAFWSLMPLLGWARYSLEPSITTCTIDWRHNDTSYKSFLSAYFLFGFAIPLVIMTYCYTAAAKRIRGKKAPAIRSSVSDKWASENNVTLMCVVLLVAFLFAWTPYAILCMWTVFAEPSTVPYWLTLIPPLFAKASTVFNPIIYYATNPRLRLGLKATLACCKTPPGEIVEMLPNELRDKANVTSPAATAEVTNSSSNKTASQHD